MRTGRTRSPEKSAERPPGAACQGTDWAVTVTEFAVNPDELAPIVMVMVTRTRARTLEAVRDDAGNRIFYDDIDRAA